MNVNWKKTKQTIIGPLGLQGVPEFSFKGNIIERVRVFNLLGLCIDQNLKWNSHTNATYAKASSRLFLLKQLKRSGVVTNDLLHFYMSVIRPVLEYACPVWHNSLTFEQSKRLEFIQKRALKIIYGGDIKYEAMCNKIANARTFAYAQVLATRS